MSNSVFHKNLLTPSDLPGILRYVRLFRRQTFFIGIDEVLIQTDSFSSILKEIEVLDSLNIRICLFFYKSDHGEFFLIKPDCSYDFATLQESLHVYDFSLRESELEVSSSLTNLAEKIKQAFDKHSVCLIRPEDMPINFKSHSLFKLLCQSTRIPVSYTHLTLPTKRIV